METQEKIKRLEEFKSALSKYQSTRDATLRSYINQNTIWARREAVEAGCFSTVTIGPPPAIGGLVMRNVDPFSMMFEAPYGIDLFQTVEDMIDQTIGVLHATPADQPTIQVDLDIQAGYAFIAMPMDDQDH